MHITYFYCTYREIFICDCKLNSMEYNKCKNIRNVIKKKNAISNYLLAYKFTNFILNI